MYKGNNTISSVIKGSSNIAKILLNGIEVWRKSLLPDGYVLCDYLESTGTQYIDTGINPTRDCKIEMNCKINTYNTSLFGAYNNANQRFQMYLGVLETNKKTAYLGYRAFTTASSQSHFDDSLMFKTGDKLNIIFDVKNSIFTANNISMDIIDDNGPDINYPIWLSCANQAGKVVTPSSMAIYPYKFYINNELLQDLIPCLDNNGTPCMYDSVSKQSFYNQGTGEFKYSINPTYLQLKHFVDGSVNASTGAVASNSTYPRAISSPLVLFEKGKTYKVTSNLSATKTDDGVRFRIYGTDDTYKQSIGASQITTNAYATFEALDAAGKANFYVAKDVLITPKQDFKTRIMYIDSNYIREFKIEEI